MGFKLGAFVGGVAKGASESIEELEKLNTTSINASVKSMYHNYQEYKKEVEKKKESLRGTVGALRGLKFSDGALDDEQLIALATNPELAKDIAETLTKNPDRLEGLSKSFIKSANVPKGQKFDDFLNDYGKKAALTSEEFATAASNKEEGFLNKMIYGNNLKKITAASRQLGVKPEELYAYGSSKSMPSYSASLEVDYAKLQKTPEFKDLKDKAMVVMYRARQEGTDEDILAAAKNMGAIKGTELLAELKEKPKEKQDEIEVDYGKRILKATDPKEKAKLMSEIRTMQEVWANPSLKKLTEGEKITTGNKLVAYKGIINSTVANYLPPGTFKTNPITGDLEVSELVKSVDYSKGKKAGMEAAIAFGTDQNGKPKSNEDKLALASVGVQFDKDGKAFAPKVEFAVEAAPAPAAPAQNRSVRGGPMSPQPKPAAAAPAQPAAPVLEFKTEAEVTAANLPKGTKIKVGGRLAEVQ
jgi:hypothetical protein